MDKAAYIIQKDIRLQYYVYILRTFILIKGRYVNTTSFLVCHLQRHLVSKYVPSSLLKTKLIGLV